MNILQAIIENSYNDGRVLILLDFYETEQSKKINQENLKVIKLQNPIKVQSFLCVKHIFGG